MDIPDSATTRKRSRKELESAADSDKKDSSEELPPSKKQKKVVEKESTPTLDEADVEMEDTKKKRGGSGLPPALERKPSEGTIATRTRKRTRGLARVPSFALAYNGLVIDDDLETAAEKKSDGDESKEESKTDDTSAAAASASAAAPKASKLEKSETEMKAERQLLLDELRGLLAPCSRRMIQNSLIDHVLWFDEDDDGNICVWVARIAGRELDESEEATNLLVTWPGYHGGTDEYWVPVICNGNWHAFQVTDIVLQEKYADVVAKDNFGACQDIIRNAKEMLSDMSDSEDEMELPSDDEFIPSSAAKKAKKKKPKKKKGKKAKRIRSKRAKTSDSGGFSFGGGGFTGFGGGGTSSWGKPVADPSVPSHADATFFNGQDTTQLSRIIPCSTKPLVGPPVPDSSKEDAIDILFSFDTTGSMFSCLDAVRNNLTKIITTLFKDIPHLRIGVLAHGDYCDKDMYYTMRWVGLTDKEDRLTEFVKNAGQTGGGDCDECYELVLHNAAREFDWGKSCEFRSLVLIGDANPHPTTRNNPHKLDWKEKAKDCKACGIKIYSVHCRGGMDCKTFYKEIAQTTDGCYLTLDKIEAFTGMMVAICHREKDLRTQKPLRSAEYKKEKQQFANSCIALEEHSVAKLKGMLSGNDQKVSGTKHELIKRIADCELYGCMPKCPECNAGRLRVIYANSKDYGHGGKGRFFCPGYYDDDEFITCTWTGDEEQIKRKKWQSK